MSVVFVHVSDIHFGQEKDDRIYIHADVKQQLIADARDVISRIEHGRAKGILVTGDIAHSGKAEEYCEAGKWLDELAASIEVENHCVQMVPGNHDLDRSKLSFGGKAILDHIRAGTAEDYENVLNNKDDRRLLFTRFEDYDAFSFGYNCPLNGEGCFSSELEVELAPGRSIRFIRINSALLCHGEERDDLPELIMSARQFIIPRAEGVENIVLVHHPLNWYKDQESVRKYVRSRTRVFISGHEHDPKVTVENVEDGSDIMLLAAGATVPYRSNDEYTFTYNIIEFDWDEKLDGLSVTMHPRVWNPTRTCFEDDPKRLGGKEPNFRLACSNFRKSKRVSSQTIFSPAAAIAEKENSFLDTSIDDITANTSDGGDKVMQPMQVGYEKARLRFFRDLFEGERIRVLVDLDALSKSFDERLSQGLERKLFDLLVRQGKLQDVERMIEKIILERKGEINQ